jgi:outer membrane protein OmpA-like peptidoglycan-associated protein
LGTASVLLDGEPVDVVFTVDPRNGTIMLSGDSVWVVFGSQALAKGANALDSAGTPNFRAGGVLEASCDGFMPNADIDFYFMNQNMAFSLGEIAVTKVGTCSGSLPVPVAMAKGVYTLQIDSMVKDSRQAIPVMRRMSASIRVNILAPTVKKTSVQKAVVHKANVQFEAYSSNLTKPAKRILNRLAKQLPRKTLDLVRIVGFVGVGGSVSHATKLSNARAKSVARYLKSQGVRGKYVISSGGNKARSAKVGQSARVTVYSNRAR